jgi:hypothetical protein
MARYLSYRNKRQQGRDAVEAAERQRGGLECSLEPAAEVERRRSSAAKESFVRR